MPFIRLPLGIRIVMEYQVFGKVVVNVYHVTTTDPIITVKLLDIVEIFENWWANTQSIGLSNNIGLIEISALNLNIENGEKVTVAVSPAIPGNVPLPATSNNVALVASFATEKTGRSFQGRTYIAGLTEDAITANEIEVAVAAFYVTNFLSLMVDLIPENAMLVVASFQKDGAPRAEGVGTPVQSIGVNTRIDTQRRRLPDV